MVLTRCIFLCSRQDGCNLPCFGLHPSRNQAFLGFQTCRQAGQRLDVLYMSAWIMCSMLNVLFIWHADKATYCMQGFVNPHMHCCGEQLGASVAPILAYNHIWWALWESVDELWCWELQCAAFACALKTYVCVHVCVLKSYVWVQVGTYWELLCASFACELETCICTRLCPQDIHMRTSRRVSRVSVRCFH